MDSPSLMYARTARTGDLIPASSGRRLSSVGGDDGTRDVSSAIGCLVCRRSQTNDSGGETRFSDNRKVYICSRCLPAWKASEMWNMANASRPKGVVETMIRKRDLPPGELPNELRDPKAVPAAKR